MSELGLCVDVDSVVRGEVAFYAPAVAEAPFADVTVLSRVGIGTAQEADVAVAVVVVKIGKLWTVFNYLFGTERARDADVEVAFGELHELFAADGYL